MANVLDSVARRNDVRLSKTSNAKEKDYFKWLKILRHTVHIEGENLRL